MVKLRVSWSWSSNGMIYDSQIDLCDVHAFIEKAVSLGADYVAVTFLQASEEARNIELNVL